MARGPRFTDPIDTDNNPSVATIKAADAFLTQTKIERRWRHPTLCSVSKFNLDKPAHVNLTLAI